MTGRLGGMEEKTDRWCSLERACLPEGLSVALRLYLRRRFSFWHFEIFHCCEKAGEKNPPLQTHDARCKPYIQDKDVHCMSHTLVRVMALSLSVGGTTENIKVQRRRPSIPSVSQGDWRAASLFRNLRQSASQNLSEKIIDVLTASSFLERFCEADWHNSETK